jgi:hypothetical protein
MSFKILKFSNRPSVFFQSIQLLLNAVAKQYMYSHNATEWAVLVYTGNSCQKLVFVGLLLLLTSEVFQLLWCVVTCGLCYNMSRQVVFIFAGFFIAAGGLANAGGEEFVTIETDQGNVRGLIKSARNGQEFSGFYGLPFAQPPLGELRWQPPKTAPQWEGILDATHIPQTCLQDDLYEPSKISGSEDCLYLNVFTRKSDSNETGTPFF